MATISQTLIVYSAEGNVVQARSEDGTVTLTFVNDEAVVGDRVEITATTTNADGTLKTAGLEGITRTSLTE